MSTQTAQPAPVRSSAWLEPFEQERRVAEASDAVRSRSGRSYYNEHDKYAAAWLRNLIAEGLIAPGDVDDRSITEIKPHELNGYSQCHFFAGIGGWSLALRLAEWPDALPVWTGSCPCQPFAECGRKGGFADERHLWPTWFRLIKKCSPAIVFGEQVASASALDWLDLVFADLEGEDYACAAADLCAAGVGAPQIRQRLYWVANADNARRQGAEWPREPHQARKEWTPPCGQPLRSDCGPWPAGPGEINRVPLLANGLPGTMGGCKGYGNAIVPPLAAEFIKASREALTLGGGGAELVGERLDAPEMEPRNGSNIGMNESPSH